MLRLARRDPSLSLLPAHRQGGACGRRGRLPPVGRPGGARPSTGCRHVDLAPGRLARAPQGRAGDPRGARRDRGRGDADAGAPARGALEALGPLRHRRALQAAGPARRRARPRDDARGEPHLPHLTRGALVPRPAEAALPLPDEGTRRAAPARRRPAHARVHHEGRLLVRPRCGRPRRVVRPLHPRLRPHLRPARSRVVPGRVGRGDDGRPRRARVHGPVPGGRERRGALGRRLRGERGDREREPTAGRGPAGAGRCAAAGRDARDYDRAGRRRPARRAHGSDHQGAARGRRGARAAARAGARRPPPQRVQAAQHPRLGIPPGRGGRGARALRHRAGLHRPDRLTRARARRSGAPGHARARDGRE